MKNIVISVSLLLSSITLIQAEEVCKIISSPAPSINDVRRTDAVAMSFSKAYYDENKKIQIRSYSNAYIDFFKQVQDYIKKDCKKYKITHNYNFTIHSIVDEHNFHFNAQWDFN